MDTSIEIGAPAIPSAAAAIQGLYAVTPDVADTVLLVNKTREALRGGTRLFQYRNKQADRRLAREQALALRAITGQASALLIINDDADLALAVGADGVHLGRDDDAGRDFAILRRRAGNPAFIIGVSCYDEMALATYAEAAGADYVAFGSFFPSTTKPNARRVEIALLQQARQMVSVPIVAIGGITLENAPDLIAAGADSLAIISGVFDASDVASRARAFNQLIRQHHV